MGTVYVYICALAIVIFYQFSSNWVQKFLSAMAWIRLYYAQAFTFYAELGI